MQKQFRSRIIFLLLPMVIAFTSCQETKPIQIGYMAALSGRLSQLGVSSREALQIVVDEWNERGGIQGRQIELVIVDDESDPAVGIRVIEELVEHEVAAIIGPLTSSMLPAIERLEGRGVLVFSPTISTDALSERDDHFIRLMPSTAEQGRILSLLMRKDEAMNAAVVYDISNEEYTSDVLDAFTERYEKGGGEILDTYPYDSREAPDFVRLSRKIMNESPDGLVLICSAIDAAAIAQQLWKADSGIALYGSRWTKTDDILEYGGRAVEGMKLVSGYFACEQSEARAFRRAFIDRVGNSPGFSSIYTYEAATILFNALARAESFTSEQLKQEIVDREHSVYCETILIDSYGDTWRSDAFTFIRDGAFQASRLD